MTAPDLDELEITVFGPGFGEAILVHIGGQQWIVIDSCIDRSTRESAPLSYLRELGLDPSVCITSIVATHWHDDHVRGLSQIVKAATRAKFYCSSALIEKEFLTIASAFNKDTTRRFTGGMNEFYEVVSYLVSHDRDVGMCGKDSRLINILGQDLPHGQNCEISSLSPSHRQYQAFMQSLTSFGLTNGQTKFRAMANDPNHVSVALHVIVGPLAFLLGADLEEANDPHLGWKSVVESPGRSQVRAMLFKVPHHGSSNGHYEAVWTDMLVPNPISIVTPFTKLRTPLPTAEDRARIRTYTNAGYLTAEGQHTKFKADDHAVSRTLSEMGAVVRELPISPGRVTVRVKPGGAPQITRSASARLI